MKSIVSRSLSVAALLTFGAVTYGQEPAQPSAPQPGARPSMDEQVTVVGCVQRETDYRQARDAGRGGVAGTGVGAGNEFVLADASSASSTTASARPGSEPNAPTGTSGSAAMTYELSGPNEGQVAQYVGRRVEISGKVKPAETSASGQPTGGATAGQPPRGVDVASKDLKLRELEVTSVRATTGTCPSSK